MGKRHLVAKTAVLWTGLLAGCGAQDAGTSSPEESIDAVTNALVPAKPTTISPKGPGYSIRPTFQWNSVATATRYSLYVSTALHPRTYEVDAVTAGCASGGTCTFTWPQSTTPLDHGDASWWVQGMNADGPGKWSAQTNFTMDPPAGAPPAPTLISPSGTVGNTPTYSWNSATGATEYTLRVRDSSSTINYVVYKHYTSTEVGCAGGGVCSIAPGATLADGMAQFQVMAVNAVALSPWSAVLEFTVASGWAPSGTIATATPTYQWPATPGATQYELWVNNPSSTTRIDVFLTPAEAGCDADNACEATPATPLLNGSTAFWVKGIVGTSGSWSTKHSFFVNAP
jgi:hypothetical protein